MYEASLATSSKMRLLLALSLVFPPCIDCSAGRLRRKAYYFNNPVTPAPAPGDEESELLNEIEQLEESLGLQDIDGVSQAPISTNSTEDQTDTGGDDQERDIDPSLTTELDSLDEFDVTTTHISDLNGAVDEAMDGDNSTNPSSSNPSTAANLPNPIVLEATTRSADRSPSNVNSTQPGIDSNLGEESSGSAPGSSLYTGIHPYSLTSLETPGEEPTDPYAYSPGSPASEEQYSPYSKTPEAPSEAIEPSAGYGSPSDPYAYSPGSPASDEQYSPYNTTSQAPSEAIEPPAEYGSPSLEQAPTGYKSNVEAYTSATAVESQSGYNTPAQDESEDTSATGVTIEPPLSYGSPTSGQTPATYSNPEGTEYLGSSASAARMEPPTDEVGTTVGKTSLGYSGSSQIGQATSETASEVDSTPYGLPEEPLENIDFIGEDTDDVEEDESDTDTDGTDLPWKDQDWANKTPKEVADLAETEALRMMEDKYVPLIVIAMTIVSTAFTLFVAQQMVENPNGIIAKFCRCMVAISRIVCYPFRLLLCCCSSSSGRSRDRRTHEVLRNRNGEFS